MAQLIGEVKIKKMQNLLKNNDICPICGRGKLIFKIIKDEIMICHKKIMVNNAKMLRCNVCGDCFYDDETLDMFERIINEIINEKPAQKQ